MGEYVEPKLESRTKAELITMLRQARRQVTDLQAANSGYVEDARKAKAETALWVEEATTWANHFADMRRTYEELYRAMLRHVHEAGQSGQAARRFHLWAGLTFLAIDGLLIITLLVHWGN